MRLNLAASSLALMLHLVVSGPPDAVRTEQVREIIRNRLEASWIPQQIVCKSDLICDSVVLPRFYENRLFSPAWSDNDGPLPFADAFIQKLEDAEQEGLRSSDYHLKTINVLLKELRTARADERLLDPTDLADLDLLLTDAFLIYGSHLLNGRVDPERIRAEWHVKGRKADLAAVLQSAIDSKQIEKALNELLPPHPGYGRLRQVLSYYRDIPATTGWPKMPDREKIRKGDAGDRVAALKDKLIILGDLDSNENRMSDRFDEEVENAVKRFQRRHGLISDGVVGRATLRHLNVSPEERIKQIEVNMERWRWLPETLGDRYILVNVANFELAVVEGSARVMAMRAIVGKHYQRTPAFSSQMTYLVLNPYWNIPASIAVKETLPLIRKDLDYLKKNDIKVFLVQGSHKAEVDPASVDWPTVSSKEFNYFFRQEPGPLNALGRIKFMFPNKFSVYLHDTPHKELFESPVREFSHGCIRIENPLELAEYLLSGDPRWTRENLLSALEGSVDRTVRLPRPIGVHVQYWTAWVDDDGKLQLRDDVYGRDALVARALEEGPPRP